jgi:ribosomal protein S18 acetylase RimI-like enzyme
VSVDPDFRPATPTDLPMVLRAERDYITAVEPEALERWTAAIDRNLGLWIANLERTTVVELDGERAGFVMWTPGDGAAVVVTVQVFPSHRRHGLGLALLDVVTRQAAEAGFALVTLGVHEANPARSLYDRAGYTRTGEDGDYLLYELPVGR